MKALRGNLHNTISLLLKKSHWCLIKKNQNPILLNIQSGNDLEYFLYLLGVFFSPDRMTDALGWRGPSSLRPPSLRALWCGGHTVLFPLEPHAFRSPFRKKQRTETENSEISIKRCHCSRLPPSFHSPMPSTPLKNLNWIWVSWNLFFILKFVWHFWQIVSWTHPLMGSSLPLQAG